MGRPDRRQPARVEPQRPVRPTLDRRCRGEYSPNLDGQIAPCESFARKGLFFGSLYVGLVSSRFRFVMFDYNRCILMDGFESDALPSFALPMISASIV